MENILGRNWKKYNITELNEVIYAVVKLVNAKI